MNEFERAQARTEKRIQRQTLHVPQITISAPAHQPVIETPAPKEKRPSTDGVIRVTVTTPYDEFEMIFTKPNITGMRKISKTEYDKAIREGLKPILGNVR